MLRRRIETVSQGRCGGYGESAARAAEGVGQVSGLTAAMPTDDALAYPARREIPAVAPLGRDRSCPEAPHRALRGLRLVVASRPAQQSKAQIRGGARMIETAPNMEDTKRRLVEAADALRRLSMSGIKPSGLRTQWPDVIHRVEEAYGWTGERVRPPRPSPAEITRMDEAIRWLLWLDADQRKVIWARSTGLSWRRIEDMDGRSMRTLQNLHATALHRILARRAGR